MTKAGNSQIMRTIPLLITIFSLSLPAYAQYSGGTGEPNDPYQIATAVDLMLLGETPEDYSKHFIMTADIDLDPNLPGRKVFDKAVIAPDVNDVIDAWGTALFDGKSFTGVFDGNGHTISNLTIRGGSFLGLFGELDDDAEISNLGLEAVDVNGTGHFVGGLVGSFTARYRITAIKDNATFFVRLSTGSITTSYSTGTVIGSGRSIGGLVGINGGSIANSYSIVIVTGDINVGGLAGDNSGYISSSYSSGSVIGNSSIGGLAGDNSGYIRTSYSSGSVKGNSDVGGLAGNNRGYISTSYSSGSVIGNSSVGGLVGYNSNSIITSYSTGKVTGDSFVGGLVGSGWVLYETVLYSVWDMETSGLAGSNGGVGLNTNELMDSQMLGLNGFGNDPNWILDAGRDYPKLAWEGLPGDIIPEPDVDWFEERGTADNPYRIDTAEQLMLLTRASALWDKHFVLGTDIDLDPNLPAGQVFTRAVIPTFNGFLDGKGHKISHLTIMGDGYLGLFGQLGSTANVSNLGLESVDVSGTGGCVGGLVGNNYGCIITCYSSGTITGDSHIGGLVGWNHGSITTSYGTGTVTGDSSIGGIVGQNESSITTSYSRGCVSGYQHVGGIVGLNAGSIADSYSTGTVAGNSDVGGLVGCDGYDVFSQPRRSGITTTSFWDMETSGQASSAGGTGLTTAEMQNIDTFLNAGWDFVGEFFNGTCDYWQLSPAEYPRLLYNANNNPTMPEGLGTVEQPYLIRDARDLGTVWFEPMAHYRLEESLDLSGITWSMAVISWFGGTFDGNGCVIINLYIQGAGYLGLFGQLDSTAKVSNLGLESVDVSGKWGCVGGLVGSNDGSITDSNSSGTITGDASVGGLAGWNNGSIATSYSSGKITGDTYIGGIVGTNYGNIAASYSSGTITGDIDVGGLAGSSAGSIAASYSSGTITGDTDVGGLAGWNNGSIATSYSTSYVSGDDNVGGFVGGNAGDITTSYSKGTVKGNNRIGGLLGSNHGSVTACHSSCVVFGSQDVGGLAGYNYGGWFENAIIADCYNIGAVSGIDTVGGLVGSNYGNINTSYTIGSVSGNDRIGGLVGLNTDSWDYEWIVSYCFWDIETSGQATSAVGTVKTTAEMQTESTFVGWSFDTVWTIDEGKDYPRLWWEDE